MWLLMVFTTLTITTCKSGNTSKTDKGETLDTTSMKQVQQHPNTAQGKSSSEQMNTFALQLFLQIHKSSEKMQNYIVSPLSVATLLSIITHGAEGETLSEITNTLGMKAKDVESLVSKFEMKSDSLVSLHTANLLATHPTFPYERILPTSFHAITAIPQQRFSI